MIFSFSVVCLRSRTRNRKQWSLVLVLLCAVFSELSTVVKYRLLLPTGTPWVVHNSDSYFILTQTYFTLWKYLQNYSHIQLPLVLYGIINPLNTVRWKFSWSKNIWRQSSSTTFYSNNNAGNSLNGWHAKSILPSAALVNMCAALTNTEQSTLMEN